jgi:lysophospholipase L1-like esterase
MSIASQAAVRPVAFRNPLGHTLVGILHEPTGPWRPCAVVLLAAGVKARVGPHGLYRRLTDMLVARGFPVLRFDFWGLGDSEGTAPEPLLPDLYGSVSCGRFVDDTRAAITFACDTCKVERVVLAGLCGGAITGVLTGARDPRVAGVLGLGLPVSVDGSNVDKVKYMSTGQLEGIRGKYLRKLTDPKSWARLLSFKTDFRLLYRSLTAAFRKVRKPVADAARADETTPPDDNLNPYFRPSLLSILGDQRPVLLIFSEADRLYWEFQEKFVQRYAFDPAAHRGSLEIAIVKDANHIFTFTEWQLDMLARSGAWLDAHFPARTATPTTPADRGRRELLKTATALLALPLLPAHGLAAQSTPTGTANAGAAAATPAAGRPSGEQVMPNPSAPIVLLGASYAGGWQLPAIAGRPVINKGVQGQESWELLNRFEQDVVAARPSAVIVWGYINDVFRAPREKIDSATARARQSFEQMIAKARAAGIEPIVATEVTIRSKDDWGEWAASWVGWAMGKQSYQSYINGHVLALNDWLRDLAKREGLLLLDLQPVVSDANGERRKGMAKEDGSHITPPGYDALIAYAVPVLEAHFR